MEESSEISRGDLFSAIDNYAVSAEKGHVTFDQLFEDKFITICQKLQCDYHVISNSEHDIVKYYFSDQNIPEWRYVLLGLFILKKVEGIDGIPSVKENQKLKQFIEYLTKIAVNTKLQPNLPTYINKKYTKTEDIFFEYNILKCTAIKLCKLMKCSLLRPIILSQCLRSILVALYQISFCPLKKSSPQFSENVLRRLYDEKHTCLNLLKELEQDIHPALYIRETMTLVEDKTPNWFKKAVFETLTNIIISKNGIENISIAMLDGNLNDKTKTWRAINIICRIILSCKPRPDFKDNICVQLLKLLEKASDDLVYERIFISFVKTLYQTDRELTEDTFLKKIIQEFAHFTDKSYTFPDSDLSMSIIQNIRLLHAIFIEDTVESQNIPIKVITSMFDVIFRLYTLTLDSLFKVQNNELKEILLKLLHEHSDSITPLLDGILFGIHTITLQFRNDMLLDVKGKTILHSGSPYTVSYSLSENADTLLKLIDKDNDLLYKFFMYLLHCLVDKEKYFKKFSEELLCAETDKPSIIFEKRLVVFRILSELSENKDLQKRLVDSSSDIVEFIYDTLMGIINNKVHKVDDSENDEYQSLFTVVMILHALVTKDSKNNYKILVGPLQTIFRETKNNELRELVEQVLNRIETDNLNVTNIDKEEQSEFDKALQDICDPLLPIRGHGIMALKKLVDRKDESVSNRKQYVFTIFQQNLKNEDSFLYLTAISGLASMANIFPDSVLSILCEEFSEFSRKDNASNETRMKLGEVLVRVIKSLGEMAPKYKSLLLNTFLNGTKDEDYLVRASSLSNLGEICRILGFKLGTIITEVLVCVHAIITTDKAVEARRAAVTVLRQILVGLEDEMISFLKEEILPIYRTLKNIYVNDPDDVMRLQAQLALEELDSNMRNFLFPKPQLNIEKKMISLT